MGWVWNLSAESRIVSWFSNGAASAVAAHLALQMFPREQVVVAYCDVSRDEHPDNVRFRHQVEEWLDHSIIDIASDKYASIEDVFQHTRYMSGVGGARCTVEMKKIPRFGFQRPTDLHIFGFTIDEEKRIANFAQDNPELFLAWPLQEQRLSKTDCFDALRAAGIEIPTMYSLGYRNNNCIGCVKSSSPGYWSKIRRDFPAVFARRAAQSRSIGCKLIKLHGKRIFLDELPEVDYPYKGEDLSCGPQCVYNPA